MSHLPTYTGGAISTDKASDNGLEAIISMLENLQAEKKVLSHKIKLLVESKTLSESGSPRDPRDHDEKSIVSTEKLYQERRDIERNINEAEDMISTLLASQEMSKAPFKSCQTTSATTEKPHSSIKFPSDSMDSWDFIKREDNKRSIITLNPPSVSLVIKNLLQFTATNMKLLQDNILTYITMVEHESYIAAKEVIDWGLNLHKSRETDPRIIFCETAMLTNFPSVFQIIEVLLKVILLIKDRDPKDPKMIIYLIAHYPERLDKEEIAKLKKLLLFQEEGSKEKIYDQEIWHMLDAIDGAIDADKENRTETTDEMLARMKDEATHVLIVPPVPKNSFDLDNIKKALNSGEVHDIEGLIKSGSLNTLIKSERDSLTDKGILEALNKMNDLGYESLRKYEIKVRRWLSYKDLAKDTREILEQYLQDILQYKNFI